MPTATRMNLSLLMLLLSFVASGCSETESVEGKAPPSNVKSDERVVFFPTYGRYDADSKTWTFQVHGHIFEPENSSTKRMAFIAIIRAADIDNGADESDFLDERVMPFLVDNERGKVVAVGLAGGSYAVGRSEANGHFSKTFSMSAIDLDVKGTDGGELKFAAVLKKRDKRRFTGRVQLISPEGLSVISDIDDTIKRSEVTDKSELIKNTFVREFQAVDGMPELYESLHDSGAVFHYVSGSPWQLYEPLKKFFAKAGFPAGTFHLKNFRLKDSSALTLLKSQKKNKLAAIQPMLKAFPKRRFLLLGDSGEQDPEIYGQLAREHEQIVGIFIRNASDENAHDKRFEDAFVDVPRDRWTVFDEPSEIEAKVRQLVGGQ